jgi:hypothetical protein
LRGFFAVDDSVRAGFNKRLGRPWVGYSLRYFALSSFIFCQCVAVLPSMFGNIYVILWTWVGYTLLQLMVFPKWGFTKQLRNGCRLSTRLAMISNISTWAIIESRSSQLRVISETTRNPHGIL